MKNEGDTLPPRINQPPGVEAVCPQCGSQEVVKNVHLSLTAETGSIGLNYKANFLLRDTEPLLADLCRRCGTVVRFHVGQPDKNWIHD